MFNIFYLGDLVQLKSGGPVLSVVELVDNHTVLCAWFDKELKLQKATLPVESLERCKKVEKEELLASAPTDN